MRILKDTISPLRCLAFSPDGQLLAAGSATGVVQLWDASAGTLKTKLTGCRSEVRGVYFRDGGAEVLGLSHLARVWHPRAGGTRGRLWAKLGQGLGPAALSPDGTHLCVWRWYTSPRGLACYSVPECRKIWRCETLDYPAALAFSPDGKILLTGGGFHGSIVLRDAASGASPQSLTGVGGAIKATVLSPDGQRIAWTSGCHLYLWCLEPPRELAHHSLGLTHFHSVRFHPSGRFFATANGDGKVDFWDAHTGQHRKAYDWKIGKLHDVIFDASGDRAACCSKTGQIVIWDIDE
jgi:WD40 repeat protein